MSDLFQDAIRALLGSILNEASIKSWADKLASILKGFVDVGVAALVAWATGLLNNPPDFVVVGSEGHHPANMSPFLIFIAVKIVRKLLGF